MVLSFHMEYKWTVLINTTLGIIMSSMNMMIVLISLPAIFRGLNIDPFAPGEFTYLLWMLMGYSLVLATILVTLGRISDMYGRVRLYTLGFIIFTIASVLLSIIPSGSGNLGALLIIVFRLVQAVGGGLLMVNSTALLTDVFPPNERGAALGLNQVSFLVGSLLGIVLGGVLVSYDWHMIFVISVPFAIAGALWSVLKLKPIQRRSSMSIDYRGNVVLGIGLALVSLALTYALMPYGNSQLGWDSPLVIWSLIIGVVFLGLFTLVERGVKDPLFDLSLFKIRQFSFGILSLFFSSLARGALMLLLTIWLQGIYLPLHGYPYTVTPFWAGIYMIPMMAGMVAVAPFSGRLSDKYGARLFSTLGLIIIGVSMFLLTTLPYNFNLAEFEAILLLNGIGYGLFSAPNTTSIMNALPPRVRGVGNGMRQTFNNIGSTISMAIFFTITITVFTQYLPANIVKAAVAEGLPQQVASMLANIPATGLLFAAFLGVNPSDALPPSIRSQLPQSILKILDSNTFLPSILGPSFMLGLRVSLYVSTALVFIGAILSSMRGQRFVYEEAMAKEKGL